MPKEPQTNTSSKASTKPPRHAASSQLPAAHVHPIIGLQQTIGNQACCQLLQAKLRVGEPNDRYEREADRVADNVMRMPEPQLSRQAIHDEEQTLQRQPFPAISPYVAQTPIQRQQEEELLQARLLSPATLIGLQRQQEEEPLQAKPAFATKTGIQRMADEEEPLQMKTTSVPGRGIAQRAVDEDEALQAKAVRVARLMPLQRMQEEEPLQSMPLQRQEEESLQARPLIGPASRLQRLGEEEEALQANANNDGSAQVSPATESRINALHGGGKPMSAGERHFFEPRFGYDFSSVRIHNDGHSAGLATSVNAQAFTVGNDIVFGPGRYAPETHAGRHLMAHELTHVVQQGAAVQRKPSAISHSGRRVQRGLWDAVVSGARAVGGAVASGARAVGSAVRSGAAAVGDAVAGAGRWVLSQVRSRARNVPGYPLLTVVIGKDPITDEVVERNATNLIRGVLSLVPGGDRIFQNLQESGAMQEAFSWIDEQIGRLNLTWNGIKALFRQAWESLSVTDLASPLAVFRKILEVFAPVLRRIRHFAAAVGRKVLEFIVAGVMKLAGPLGQQVMRIMRRGRQAFMAVVEDPIGFVRNLVHSVARGFRQFKNNILRHLRSGLMGWLFGTLSDAGIQVPERLNLRGILSLVFQILGLTYARMRSKMVRLIGERAVAFLERTFEFLRLLVTQGPAAAWEKFLEYLGNLRDMIIEQIKQWVVTRIVQAAITRLISMFNPAGAIIQAIMAIYNTVQFFIERARQIMALANAVFESIVNIASGRLQAAADYVEASMARTIPVIISFLARLLGLGGIADRIRGIIQRIQTRVDQAVDRVIAFIVRQARRLIGRRTDPQSREEGDDGDVRSQTRRAVRQQMRGVRSAEDARSILRRIYEQMQNLGLRRLELIGPDDDGQYSIKAEASPFEELLKLVPKGRTVVMMASLRLSGDEPLLAGSAGMGRTRVAARDQEGRIRIDEHGRPIMVDDQINIHPAQAEAGRRVERTRPGGVIGASASDSSTLEVVTWNTGGEKDFYVDSNATHAERQFTNWFSAQPPEWKRRVQEINLNINWSPCVQCGSSLVHLMNALRAINPGARGTIRFEQMYPSDAWRATTPASLAALREAGWTVIPGGTNPADSELEVEDP